MMLFPRRPAAAPAAVVVKRARPRRVHYCDAGAILLVC